MSGVGRATEHPFQKEALRRESHGLESYLWDSFTRPQAFHAASELTKEEDSRKGEREEEQRTPERRKERGKERKKEGRDEGRNEGMNDGRKDGMDE